MGIEIGSLSCNLAKNEAESLVKEWNLIRRLPLRLAMAVTA